jgi:hypothetical protein
MLRYLLFFVCLVLRNARYVINWANEHDLTSEPNLGSYTSAFMHNFTFESLNLKMNHPYLYVHAGDCSHYLVFEEMRQDFVCFCSAFVLNFSITSAPRALSDHLRTVLRQCGFYSWVARLIHPSDIQNRTEYPLQVFQCKIRRRKCGICELFPAK